MRACVISCFSVTQTRARSASYLQTFETELYTRLDMGETGKCFKEEVFHLEYFDMANYKCDERSDFLTLPLFKRIQNILHVTLSVCVPVCLSVCVSVCLSVCPSLGQRVYVQTFHLGQFQSLTFTTQNIPLEA